MAFVRARCRRRGPCPASHPNYANNNYTVAAGSWRAAPRARCRLHLYHYGLPIQTDTLLSTPHSSHSYWELIY